MAVSIWLTVGGKNCKTVPVLTTTHTTLMVPPLRSAADMFDVSTTGTSIPEGWLLVSIPIYKSDLSPQTQGSNLTSEYIRALLLALT